ncbi:MAG: hypothetical protein E6R03_04275 [Hyphomicrobiaceae bacterium]|nr:MAG: hypothetical protein E6R03_04275 [Hyphomicrobiaceae bacterium]
MIKHEIWIGIIYGERLVLSAVKKLGLEDFIPKGASVCIPGIVEQRDSQPANYRVYIEGYGAEVVIDLAVRCSDKDDDQAAMSLEKVLAKYRERFAAAGFVERRTTGLVDSNGNWYPYQGEGL